MRILVVDDSKEDLLVADRVFRQCKLLNPISQFRTADECIAYIDGSDGGSSLEFQTAIIFLDLMMSPKSGLDILRHLQGHAYAKHCISVMLSGLTDIKAINEGVPTGAKTFLLKPITPYDVVEFLNSVPDQITIEEAENGYALQWSGLIKSDTDIFRRASRITTLTA